MVALFPFYQVLAAIALDELLGEPSRYHPLVGFGKIANWLEKRLNSALDGKQNNARLKLQLSGFLSVVLLLSPPSLIMLMLPHNEIGTLLNVLVLYWAIGRQSLMRHAQQIAEALSADNIALARQRIGLIVSRQTDTMTNTDVSRAAVESVLENGSDAIFAAIFWFVLAGAPGVVMFRLSNTLDAMWGYRNERFNYFGWAAAKLDDALNWLPARCTAIAYGLAGNLTHAIAAWAQGAPQWDSPNAGPVMASGAGSLGLKLGGPACYEGEIDQRPWLGDGKDPEGKDIERALGLLDRTLLIWLVALALIYLLHGWINGILQ